MKLFLNVGTTDQTSNQNLIQQLNKLEESGNILKSDWLLVQPCDHALSSSSDCITSAVKVFKSSITACRGSEMEYQ